jgi:hypothetical protein
LQNSHEIFKAGFIIFVNSSIIKLCINYNGFSKRVLYPRKLVGKHAELEFVTAPHIIPSDNPEEQVDGNLKSKFKPLPCMFRTNMVGGSVSLPRVLMLMKTQAVT